MFLLKSSITLHVAKHLASTIPEFFSRALKYFQVFILQSVFTLTPYSSQICKTEEQARATQNQLRLVTFRSCEVLHILLRCSKTMRACDNQMLCGGIAYLCLSKSSFSVMWPAKVCKFLRWSGRIKFQYYQHYCIMSVSERNEVRRRVWELPPKRFPQHGKRF